VSRCSPVCSPRDAGRRPELGPFSRGGVPGDSVVGPVAGYPRSARSSPCGLAESKESEKVPQRRDDVVVVEHDLHDAIVRFTLQCVRFRDAGYVIRLPQPPVSGRQAQDRRRSGRGGPCAPSCALCLWNAPCVGKTAVGVSPFQTCLRAGARSACSTHMLDHVEATAVVSPPRNGHQLHETRCTILGTRCRS